MRRLFVAALAMVAAVAFTPVHASANVKVSEAFQPGVQLQYWVLLDEDARYKVSGGEDQAFGFYMKRNRFSMKGKVADGMIGYKVNVEAAGSSLTLKDMFGQVNMGGGLSVRIGQYKPFTNQEAASSSKKLANIERAMVVKSTAKAFYVNNNSFRDLGVQITKKIKGVGKFMLHVGNGLGAAGDGRDVGGKNSKGDVTANAFGDVAIVFGVVLNPMKGLRINASYGSNQHDNAVVGKDTKVSIDRTIYSVGGKFSMGKTGLWLEGEYINFQSGSKDAAGENEIKGYYVRAGFKATKQLEALVRYESEEVGKTNAKETTGIAVGVNYYIHKLNKLQLEWYQKDPDGGDSYSATRLAVQINI